MWWPTSLARRGGHADVDLSGESDATVGVGGFEEPFEVLASKMRDAEKLPDAKHKLRERDSAHTR